MADWDRYSFSEEGDESDSDGVGAGGMLVADGGGDGGPGDCVQLLARLSETVTSGAMFERKSAARGLVEVFRQIYYAEQDVGGVIAIIEKLVDDAEQSVRTEVMDQMPQIALFCHEESPRLDFVVPQHILPHIVRSLTDHFTKVRQASQSGLLILLERGIIASSQITDCVLPIILDYTQQFAPEDLRYEMTAFMIKLAPLAGKEITVNSYLDLFCRLCDDSLVQVRKVCATGMGDLANVIGSRLTEVVILPKFLGLCKDTMWSVRKNCAEVFTVVSTVSQLVTRKKILAPAFVALLQDSSKWVRVAAYQTLGPFITTFAADDSTTCTQESSEIEQTFLERFTALQTKETGGGDSDGGGGGNGEEVKAGGEEGGGNLALETVVGENAMSGTCRETHDGNLEKPAAAAAATTTAAVGTTGSEHGCDTAIGTPRSALVKNNTEPNGYNSGASSDSCPSSNSSSSSGEIELRVEIQPDEPISNDKSSETNTPGVPGPGSVGANDNTTQECLEENAPDKSLSRVEVGEIKEDVKEEGGSGGGDQVKEFDSERVEGSEGEEGSTESKTAGGDEANLDGTTSSSTLPTPTGVADGEGEACKVVVIEEGGGGKECVKEGNDTHTGAGVNMGNLEVPSKGPNGEAQAGGARAAGDGSKEQVCLWEDIEVIQETIEMSFDEESPMEAPVTDENVNNSEEPMETDELFDGADDDKQEEEQQQRNENDDVYGSYLDLCKASKGENGSEDSTRMPSVRLMDPYDDDDWDPENTFPYGGDLSSVWGGKGCRPRLLEDIPKSLTVNQQDVVPVDLLEHYTSMCEPMKNQAMDNALTGFCAYNLPAVVLTLGPQNWSILRECYESLACSMQWKIRYTLASSLHEIARVIGPELAERDLVPFFNALVKDVDEVRVGILKNLASFIKILGTVERRKCLESLRSFLDTDNERNWRFRLEILRQVEQLTELYDADEIYKYLRPLALDLVKDGVAEVRKTALSVITNLIMRVRSTLSCGEPNLVHDFLLELVESLCQSDKWVRRQTFAALSGQLIGVGALKPVQFAEDVLPHLANLSYDPVPNVRLIVAQTMVSCVKKIEFDEQSSQLISRIIEALQDDKDRDVRYFSSLEEDRIMEGCTNSEM